MVSPHKRVEILSRVMDFIKGNKDLPAFPSSASRLINLCQNLSSSLDDIAAVVKLDPGLTSQFLRVSNMAYYSSYHEGHKVESIEESLSILGLQEVKRTAALVSILSLRFTNKTPNFPYIDFWRHSLLTARIIDEMCLVSGQQSGKEYLCGLLHDIGKLFLACHIPEVCTHLVVVTDGVLNKWYSHEKLYFDMDHAEIGFALGQWWNLSPEILNGILYHHCAGSLQKEKSTTSSRLAQSINRASDFAHGIITGMEIGAVAAQGNLIADVDIDALNNALNPKRLLEWADSTIDALL